MAAKYGKRKGLEGPTTFVNGMVLYFDPIENKWWDPTTDFYMSDEDMDILNQMLFALIAK